MSRRPKTRRLPANTAGPTKPTLDHLSETDRADLLAALLEMDDGEAASPDPARSASPAGLAETASSRFPIAVGPDAAPRRRKRFQSGPLPAVVTEPDPLDDLLGDDTETDTDPLADFETSLAETLMESLADHETGTTWEPPGSVGLPPPAEAARALFTGTSATPPDPDETRALLQALLDEPPLPPTTAVAAPPPAAAQPAPVSEEAAPVSRPRARQSQPVATDISRRSAAMDDLDRVLQVGASRPTTASKWRVRIVWALVLGGLTWLAFQPYPFEVGGDFTVQPIDRAEARARTDGEIIALHVTEGDWVEKDQVLAVISNWDEERDVVLNRADGDRLRAELETMQAGPRPEQISLAEEGLRAAQMQVDITARDLERQEQLFASGTIPEREVLAARDAHDLALTRRAEAEANLALVSVGALQTQIDAQLAAIARNDEELAFAELMLEYTNVRAPAAGQIVSDMATVPVGAYLSTGALFAEIEDNRTVIATINLPEITIEEVAVGAPVELRLWSAPEDNILGTVRAIAPRAETSDFGPVLRVQVEVPNPEGRLAANMTGFGKIAAGERPVWEVFSRAIYRFFTIELWSWLP